MGSDPQYAKYPLLPLAQHIFTLTNPQSPKTTQQTSLKSLQDAITDHKMAPLYRYLAHPTEGILNGSGETSQKAAKPQGRKPSAAGMVASKHSIPKVDLPWNEALYEKLKAENDAELEGYKKEEEEAEEKAGETEVQAARGKRADFWARVGDKVWSGCSVLKIRKTNTCIRTVLLHPTKKYLKILVFWELKSILSLLLFELACSSEINN
jgi:26S proteasome regulatory subunit N7